MPRVWLERDSYGREHKYRIRWRDPQTGRVKSQTIGWSRREAIQAAAEKRRQLRTMVTHPEWASWREFADQDLAHLEATRAAGTVDIQRRVYIYFYHFCRPRTLADVDFPMIEKYCRARLKRGINPATANSDLRALQAGLNRAVRRGLIKDNPFTNNRQGLYVKEPEPVPKVLEREEFNRLLGTCPTDYWQGICLVGYWTGLRAGEILALEWSDVDFRRKVLHVWNKPFHRTKSGKIRSIPIVEKLKDFLWRLRVKIGAKEGLVFDSTSLKPGRQRRVKRISTAFAVICRRAGLVKSDGKNRFSMHDLRRSCISEWLVSGVDPKSVQYLAGHEDIKTTMKHYAAVMTAKNLQEAVSRRC